MDTIKFQNFRQQLPILIQTCQEISEVFGFTLSEALILFHYFKWNDYALNEVLASQEDYDQILIKSGAKSATQYNLEKTCPICYCNQSEISLSCGHSACKSCFELYLREKLKMSSFINCFFLGCTLKIPYSFFEEHKDYQQSYLLRLSKDYRTTVKCCNNQECEFYVQSYVDNIVECLCGTVFCVKCEQGDHRLLNCQQCVEWVKLYEGSNNILDFINHGKFCPKCNQFIEKDLGCNHMTCRKPLGCGFEFCWICMDTWSSHSKETGGYYKCNKYNEQQIEEKNKLKADKSNEKRLIFYAIRYAGHEKGQQIALKKKRRFLDLVSKIQLVDSYKILLRDSYNYIIQARISLKWTYVYAFFQKKQMPIFEFGQADFERYCEILHDLLENEIYKKLKSKQPIEQYHQKLLNNYNLAKQFQTRFLSEFKNPK
ncbi:unnamed protein product [Paramecium primaurelia]|uniref:RBR-type E3 ubiquitin transferase n=1 Tax=Paramecium primaurelia TaxID=5886 RepID=A0A8S1NXE9_PARPR|nr:unnamed protein product [Paramecium primaurelia]